MIIPRLRGALGLGAVVLAAGGVAAVMAALRTRRAPGRVIAIAAAALLIAIAYVFTPYSAQGFEGQPDPNPNARYVVPALVLLAPLAAWAATRPSRVGVALQVVAAASVLYGVAGTDGYLVPIDAGSLVIAAAIVGVATAGGFIVWRLRRAGRVAALRVAAGVALVAALGVGYLGHRGYDDLRYAGLEPAIDWILHNAPEDRRVGLAGLGYNLVIYPAFGPELENDVRYVGPTVDGMLRPYTRRESLLDALRNGRYDVLVFQRQGWVRHELPARQEKWLREDGWRVVAESERVALYLPESAQAGLR